MHVGSDAVYAAIGAASCKRRHKARRKNLANKVVGLICNVQVPKRIHGNTTRPTKRGCSTHAIRKGRASRASERCDHARGADSTHAVAKPVSHVHTERRRVHRHTMRPIEYRRRALPIRPPRRPAPRQRAHVPVAGRLRSQPNHGACGGGGARGAGGGRAGVRAHRARGCSERAGGGARGAVGPRKTSSAI